MPDKTWPETEDGIAAREPGLGGRALEGSLWLLTGRIYRQVLFVGRAVVLGRLLTPRDFGLVGLGDLALMFLGVLSYTGFDEGLVQRPHLTPRVIHTAWWVILGRSFLMGATLWITAPRIALLVQDPAATSIIRALALVQVLSGFTSMGVTLLGKDLQFRSILKWEVSGVTLDLLVAITAALIWRNAWALVLGAAAGALTRVIVSYTLHPYKPRFVFDLKAAWELFKFGRWLLFSSILYFAISKGTDAVSGIIFGAASLGLYQMASRFALLPNYHFGETFQLSLFPAYSKIQGDRARLTAAFLKVLQVACFIVFPLSAVMAVAVAPVLPLFLGSKWQAVVNLAPPLAVGGALQALLRTGTPLFMATGKTRCQFAMDLASVAGIGLCIYPLSSLLGLEGLAWSYAGGIALGLPVWWRFVREQVEAKSSELVLAIVPALLGSLLLAGTVWLPAKLFHLNFSQWGALGPMAVLVLLGGAAYLAVIFIMERLMPGYQPLRASLNLLQAKWKKKGGEGPTAAF